MHYPLKMKEIKAKSYILTALPNCLYQPTIRRRVSTYTPQLKNPPNLPKMGEKKKVMQMNGETQSPCHL